MLSRGRIDVNLENSENLRTAFNSTGLNPSEFLTFIAKEKSVGVYFTYTFLKREPGFLGKFNTTLQECKNN